MSRSPTTTNPDWLHNTHPGEMLVSEFMEPLSLDAETLALALGYSAERLRTVITGQDAMNAELDLRLGRYFKMSEGFFMRLQVQHDIIAAKRALNGDLNQIVPRAA